MVQQINLMHKKGQGISPQQFIDGMKVREMKLSNIPNTKEELKDIYENFNWDNDEEKQFFISLGKNVDLYCLILCTDWCPDVIWNVPVLFRILEESQIPTEVLLMEEHLETMDLFLTDGGRAQPIAVFIESRTGNVIGRWGARPAYIQAVMDLFKRNNPDKQAINYQDNLNQVYREIGEIYHKDKQYQTVLIRELRTLLSPCLT